MPLVPSTQRRPGAVGSELDGGGTRRQTKEGLDAILAPRAVAVIGASPKQGSVGHALLRSILGGGFRGPVYPVHPTAREILGQRTYASVLDIPGPIDLAVVAVPAAAVVEVVRACGRKGVRGLVVVSAGFREADEEGARREADLREAVHAFGMRMVGPNCLGVLNASDAVRLHATFGERAVLPGSAALVTQSGAVGIALMEHAAHVGLGLSRFVSMGNKTDVSGNDLLLLWEDDPEVQQVLLYLENFGNPRNFVRIARRLTRTKPILVVKSGRTARGARAAGSHTGALMQSDALVDALLEQCGVFRAQSVEELFDAATAFASQPPMAGGRVAIVTNSGGPAILAVDALEGVGLGLAEFSAATVARVSPFLPSASHPVNPLDLLAGGDARAFEASVAAALDDPGVDGVLAIWTPLEPGQSAQAEAIAAAARARDAGAAAKPVVAVVFGHGPGTPAFEALRAGHVPAYAFPENAVRSLAALRQAGAWRARPEEPDAEPRVDAAAVRAILSAARPGPDGWLPMRDALAVLDAYGIRTPRRAWAADRAALVQAAATARYPAVLKLDAPGLVHKSEAGAVRLGLTDAKAAVDAYDAAVAAVAARGYTPSGALLMEAVPDAPEVLVGATQDELFGPVLACAAGGIYTEILRDAQVRLAPVSAPSAQRMVARMRIAPILAGARGRPAADVDALADVLVRMARLATDFPGIAEVEANPVRVLARGSGAIAVDARLRLGVPPA